MQFQVKGKPRKTVPIYIKPTAAGKSQGVQQDIITGDFRGSMRNQNQRQHPAFLFFPKSLENKIKSGKK